ncbi:MAG: nuclear transport factor 2 family protein [Arenimonas sp.]
MADDPHPNAALLRRLYTAFAVLDAATMAECYAPDARFQDEVFRLAGRDQVGAMWAMLCSATRDTGRDVWKLEYGDVSADDRAGHAHWQAHYRFSATGRMVHNRIDASFVFRDGLIAEHHDRFDFWAWSRQALGTPGLLLGWTPMLRNKVRAQAATKLALFRAGR